MGQEGLGISQDLLDSGKLGATRDVSTADCWLRLDQRVEPGPQQRAPEESTVAPRARGWGVGTGAEMWSEPRSTCW